MKDLIRKGRISVLMPEDGEGGMSKEVHLLKHKENSYILRKCANKERADSFEEISKIFEKYGFLPKLLGRHKNNLVFEYLPGRDLRQNDAPKVAESIGKIYGTISKIRPKKIEKINYFKKFIHNLDYLLEKKIITQHQYERIMDRFKSLSKKIHPKWGYDLGDICPNNFRLSNGKVYFVDIEAINNRIIGVGFAKAFLKWFKTEKQRRLFLKGYNSASSSKFMTNDYLQFIYIYFLVNNTISKIKSGLDYGSNLKRMDEFIQGSLK